MSELDIYQYKALKQQIPKHGNHGFDLFKSIFKNCSFKKMCKNSTIYKCFDVIIRSQKKKWASYLSQRVHATHVSIVK